MSTKSLTMIKCASVLLISFLCFVNSSYSFSPSSVHCAVRREISPCTCRHADYMTQAIVVSCEKMSSFGQVVDALQDRFERPEQKIILKISVSNLDDMQSKTFEELGMNMITLHLKHNNISVLYEDVFYGCHKVSEFSIADNVMLEVPGHILRLMPKINHLDLSRNQIQRIRQDDLKGLPSVGLLLIANNQLTHIEKHSFPSTLKHLHLAMNNLTSLNDSLNNLKNLQWLWLNNNKLVTLENQLRTLHHLILLECSQNHLESLPSDISVLHNLNSLFAINNSISDLNGVLKGLSKLRIVSLPSNRIKMIRTDEFAGLKHLADLILQNNSISSINSSLVDLLDLEFLDLSYNLLKHLDIYEIRGLKKLRVVDLSYNRISKLIGKQETKNLVEVETIVHELRLQHNEIENLDGALIEISGLLRLNLSHNKLKSISPDDFIKLDELKMLDISYNYLTTLEETSKTFLPALEELMASHNALTALEKDFHGLPVLCLADLAHNNIKAINVQLAIKSQCKIHGLNSTLRIYLQGNPVLCEKSMKDAIAAIEAQNNTKVHGDGETVCQENPAATTTSTTTMVTTSSTSTSTTTTSTKQIPPTTPEPVRTTTSTTTEVPTMGIDESTETITFELPQPLENINQISGQNRVSSEDKEILLDDKIDDGKPQHEDKIVLDKIYEEKIMEEKLIEPKLFEDKIEEGHKILEFNVPIPFEEKLRNQIPTSESAVVASTDKPIDPSLTETKLSPLFSVLDPRIEYVVDNATESNREFRVIKN